MDVDMEDVSVAAPAPAASAMATLFLEDYQLQQTNQRNDVGGAQVYNKDHIFKILMKMLREDNYDQYMYQLSTANQDLVLLLRRFTVSKYYNRAAEGGDAQEALDLKKMPWYELMIGLMVQEVNEHIYAFFQILLSLQALRTRTPRSMWGVLSSLRILYGWEQAKEIAVELGRYEMSPKAIPPSSSKIVMEFIYDNCMYRLGTDFEHIDQSEQNDNYQTINWMHSMLPDVFDSKIAEEYARNGNSWIRSLGDEYIVQIMTDFDRHDAYIGDCWTFFVGQLTCAAKAGDQMWRVIAHPNYKPPGGRTRFVYQEHVPTMHGTARYKDNELLLGKATGLIKKLGRKVAFGYGDQQSFNRMTHLKRNEGTGLDMILPLGGDFHYLIHALMAIHKLWWVPLISWVVRDAGLCSRACDSMDG